MLCMLRENSDNAGLITIIYNYRKKRIVTDLYCRVRRGGEPRLAVTKNSVT